MRADNNLNKVHSFLEKDLLLIVDIKNCHIDMFYVFFLYKILGKQLSYFKLLGKIFSTDS